MTHSPPSSFYALKIMLLQHGNKTNIETIKKLAGLWIMHCQRSEQKAHMYVHGVLLYPSSKHQHSFAQNYRSKLWQNVAACCDIYEVYVVVAKTFIGNQHLSWLDLGLP